MLKFAPFRQDWSPGRHGPVSAAALSSTPQAAVAGPGFRRRFYPQLQPLHDEGMADICGRAVSYSGLAVINRRETAVPLRSCSRNGQLAYATDIRLLLRGLDTAIGNRGVKRHGSGVESPTGRLRGTKPVAWVVAEAGVLRMSRRVLETPGAGDSRAEPPPSAGRESSRNGFFWEPAGGMFRSESPGWSSPGFVEPGQVAERNQVHPPVSPGVPCEDWHPPPPAPV